MSDRCDNLEPLLSAWVDGELRAGERARVGSHLQRCARCRATIRELRVTQSMLRSLPTHRLTVDVLAPGGSSRRGRSGLVRRVAARSTAAMAAVTILLGVAAFAAGGEDTPQSTPVPVDVYVADHLVRAIGGPVSTPALLHSTP
jgi:anti-sigma factor RsiW